MNVRLCVRACPDCHGPLVDGYPSVRISQGRHEKVLLDNFCVTCAASWNSTPILWFPMPDAKLYVVVGLQCVDCMGDDPPEVIGTHADKSKADEAAEKWWGGTCGRAFVLEATL